jgi:hypothetical protein
MYDILETRVVENLFQKRSFIVSDRDTKADSFAIYIYSCNLELKCRKLQLHKIKMVEFIEYKVLPKNKGGNLRINATLSRFQVTIVAVEKL